MRRLYAIGLLIAGLAVAGPALAVKTSLTLQQAMTTFALVGEWAAHCDQPPSGKNAHTNWSANSDTAGALVTDFGGGQKMSYTATAADLIGGDEIHVSLTDNQDEKRLELIIQKQDSRIRTLSSVQSDGSVLIKNGKFASNGSDTVAQERCK